MTAQTAVPAVRRTVSVKRTVEEAFRVFTEEIASWWPVESHSIAGVDAVPAFDGREGGRLYERTRAGAEDTWGRVLAWEPPTRVVLEWLIGPEGSPPTEVEVRFREDGEGTLVELEHRGWDRVGADASARRASYDGGWTTVLGRYADRVGGEVS
jgi:uncharacterized protein YndB with AHSA1/START domain